MCLQGILCSVSSSGDALGSAGTAKLTTNTVTHLLCRPFPSEETAENDDDVYRSLEELAE